jgi:cytochrome c6
MRRVIQIACVLGIALVASSARADDGAALYERKCATCHGKDGKGRTRMGEKLGLKELAAVVAGGPPVKAADLERIVRDGKGRMPAFKDKLSDAEIKSVAAYVEAGIDASPPHADGAR